MLRTLLKHKGPLKGAGLSLALIASVALAWFTINAPERGRDPLAAAMEENSALYFATERDITALAQDAKTGAARSIGLSAEYALVSLKDGGRYYVRTGEQAHLLTELLKDKLAGSPQLRPAVFSLPDVQPPAPPLTTFLRQFGPGSLSLLGPLLILYLILMMNPFRGAAGMFKVAQKPQTRFKDVVGVEEAKEALQDIVAYLKKPDEIFTAGREAAQGHRARRPFRLRQDSACPRRGGRGERAVHLDRRRGFQRHVHGRRRAPGQEAVCAGRESRRPASSSSMRSTAWESAPAAVRPGRPRTIASSIRCWWNWTASPPPRASSSSAPPTM